MTEILKQQPVSSSNIGIAYTDTLDERHGIQFELESSLIDAKAKKQTIEAEKLTGDNIYKVL